MHFNDVSDKDLTVFGAHVHLIIRQFIYQNKKEMDLWKCMDVFVVLNAQLHFLKENQLIHQHYGKDILLLNNVYSNIFNYENNIKPAPDPYYLLDKYYGNLSIEEYRKLLNNQQLLLVVDKPLTKVLPELFEENNDMPTIYSNLLTEKKIKIIFVCIEKFPKFKEKYFKFKFQLSIILESIELILCFFFVCIIYYFLSLH